MMFARGGHDVHCGPQRPYYEVPDNQGRHSQPGCCLKLCEWGSFLRFRLGCLGSSEGQHAAGESGASNVCVLPQGGNPALLHAVQAISPRLVCLDPGRGSMGAEKWGDSQKACPSLRLVVFFASSIFRLSSGVSNLLVLR